VQVHFGQNGLEEDRHLPMVKHPTAPFLAENRCGVRLELERAFGRAFLAIHCGVFI
jgi:hypothetical protein